MHSTVRRYYLGLEEPCDQFVVRKDNYWFGCPSEDISEIFEGVIYG